MPPGLLVTVPFPLPVLPILRIGPANVAVHVMFWLTVTTPSAQSAAPLHPLNVDPLAGVAVSVTAVPVAYASEQSAPHVMPAGLLVTVPAPVPCLVTVSVATAVNVAVQVMS
jgi:hypothetical protein